MYRAMVKAPDRAGLNFSGPEKGAAVHLRKCRKLGIKMPAAIVIGGAPNLGYVSVSAIPRDVDEFGVAGAIAGEPVELVKCKTIDLNVPAYAEVVIEGIVDPELVEPEAPFGESYGFVGPMDMNPFIQITAITHRKQPIWMATLSQYPPSESTKMRQLGNQGTVLRHLRQSLKMDWVLDIALFEEASSGRVMAIKLKGATSARAQATLDAAAKRAPYTKIIIVVDEDVNVHDLGSVLLAVAMRTQPHRDYRIDSYPAISLSDYSLEPLDSLAAHQSGTQHGRPNASRLLIDATMKWPYPPTSLPKKQYMDEAIRIWREEGLPTLDIKPPLFGVNLGYWTEEHERHAQAAILGESYQAGLDYEKKRRRELNQV
jgi:4-hydroxy-3-polyprenylbenzoate decarboxylase